jgi:hypothetical protein
MHHKIESRYLIAHYFPAAAGTGDLVRTFSKLPPAPLPPNRHSNTVGESYSGGFD